MTTDIDWQAVRNAYITEDISYAELGKRYNIPRSTVAQRGKQEDWGSQRASHRAEDPLAGLRTATRQAVTLLMETLADRDQFHRYLVQTNTADGRETGERIFPKLDTGALKQVVGMLKDLTALQRELHDLPTAAEAEARQIALQRLEMDRQKLTGAGKVEVVLSAGDESWNT